MLSESEASSTRSRADASAATVLPLRSNWASASERRLSVGRGQLREHAAQGGERVGAWFDEVRALGEHDRLARQLLRGGQLAAPGEYACAEPAPQDLGAQVVVGRQLRARRASPSASSHGPAQTPPVRATPRWWTGTTGRPSPGARRNPAEVPFRGHGVLASSSTMAAWWDMAELACGRARRRRPRSMASRSRAPSKRPCIACRPASGCSTSATAARFVRRRRGSPRSGGSLDACAGPKKCDGRDPESVSIRSCSASAARRARRPPPRPRPRPPPARHPAAPRTQAKRCRHPAARPSPGAKTGSVASTTLPPRPSPPTPRAGCEGTAAGRPCGRRSLVRSGLGCRVRTSSTSAARASRPASIRAAPRSGSNAARPASSPAVSAAARSSSPTAARRSLARERAAARGGEPLRRACGEAASVGARRANLGHGSGAPARGGSRAISSAR